MRMIHAEPMQYINIRLTDSDKFLILNYLYQNKLVEFVSLNQTSNSKHSPIDQKTEYRLELSNLETCRSNLELLKQIMADNNLEPMQCCNIPKISASEAEDFCRCKSLTLPELSNELTTLVKNITEYKTIQLETRSQIENLKRELAITGELQFLNTPQNSDSRSPSSSNLEQESNGGMEAIEMQFSAGTIPISKLHLLKQTLKTLVRGNLIFHCNTNFDSTAFNEKNGIIELPQLEAESFAVYVCYTSANIKRLDDICKSLGADILINRNIKTKVAITKVNELSEIHLDQLKQYALLLQTVEERYIELQQAHERWDGIFESLRKGVTHDRVTYLEGWIPKGRLDDLEFPEIKQELVKTVGIKSIGVFAKLRNEVPEHDSSISATLSILSQSSISSNSTTRSEESIISQNNIYLENREINYEPIDISDSVLNDRIMNNREREELLKTPTHMKVMKIFEGFQGMSDAFGISSTEELNPALFTTFLFPFLFGAMYADVLHGLIFFFGGIVLIKFKHLFEGSESLSIVVSGRYCVLFNGVAAITWGLMYGECAGVHLPNPISISTEWLHSPNFAEFFNSLRLKLSLIIGYFHMLLGSLIALYNHLYRSEHRKILCFWLPQFIAYNCFLGYLVSLIYIKWILGKDVPILGILVGMFTRPFESLNKDEMLYSGQATVQKVLFYSILISFPWMFAATPIYNQIKARRQIVLNEQGEASDIENTEQINEEIVGINENILGQEIEEEEDHESLLMFGVETMEFGIALISNTSSYLRIWAVNLAHSELAKITFDNSIGKVLAMEHWLWRAVFALPSVSFFIMATLLILVGLEGMSSVLNAMRLNWIEYFGKFFKSSGRKFVPLGEKVEEE